MAIEKEEIVTELRAYFSNRGHEIGTETLLFDYGAIDSIGVIELIDSIENMWGVQIPMSEITQENISTIESISMLIYRLISSATEE